MHGHQRPAGLLPPSAFDGSRRAEMLTASTPSLASYNAQKKYQQQYEQLSKQINLTDDRVLTASSQLEHVQKVRAADTSSGRR